MELYSVPMKTINGSRYIAIFEVGNLQRPICLMLPSKAKILIESLADSIMKLNEKAPSEDEA